jgi:hypothetical protein
MIPSVYFCDCVVYFKRLEVFQTTYLNTSINIIYFPFHVNLTYIFMQHD